MSTEDETQHEPSDPWLELLKLLHEVDDSKR